MARSEYSIHVHSVFIILHTVCIRLKLSVQHIVKTQNIGEQSVTAHGLISRKHGRVIRWFPFRKSIFDFTTFTRTHTRKSKSVRIFARCTSTRDHIRQKWVLHIREIHFKWVLMRKKRSFETHSIVIIEWNSFMPLLDLPFVHMCATLRLHSTASGSFDVVVVVDYVCFWFFESHSRLKIGILRPLTPMTM